MVLLCLSFLVGGAAKAATPPTGTDSSSRANATTLPAALRPALYRALAHDARPAYTIGKDGCATLSKQRLEGCFTADGAHFGGVGARPLALRLAAWGRDGALHAVSSVTPVITGNRVSYAHGGLTEWWQVLPVGFEQGFSVSKRPAGDGELTLALNAGGKPVARSGTVALGKLRYGDLVVTDATGRVLPSTLTTKSYRILIAVNDAHAAYPLTVDPLVWIEQKVTASDGAEYDEFGWSVAIDGNTALFGAYDASINDNAGQGAVYVFERSDGFWSQTQKLTASDGATVDGFGWSLAVTGNIALIGAPSVLGSGQGAAYIFTKSGGTWSQTAKLTASDGAANDDFGYSVALDGTTALAGAPQARIGGMSEVGAAYVFDDSGGAWSQTAKLTASDGTGWAVFGWSVALDGTTALIGAPVATVGDVPQGAVYVFDDSGGSWTQAQKLTADDGAGGDDFGFSATLDGATALAGAPNATIGGNQVQGAVYVFDDSGGAWSQKQKFTASDGEAGDNFGSSIALAGTTSLVGAPAASANSDSSLGAAYVFTDSGGTWYQTAKLTASDGVAYDYVGNSVALAGITAIAGAPGIQAGGNAGQGAAYVYTATCPQGYSERDGTLNAGGLYGSPPYQAPAGEENGIVGGPASFQLYAAYSNGGAPHLFPIPGNEIHKLGPAGTYRWGVKAGSTGGDYVLCILHP